MFVVVGLGNPEPKYFKTNHNVGFMVIDNLAKKLGVTFNKKGFQGEYAELNIKGEKVILLKPSTYMNLSGNSVSAVAKFYKVDTNNILVCYDDIDIDVGKVRIRLKGSAGTHNGMRNIVNCLNSQDFPRIRVGIKSTHPINNLIDYVLSDIRKDDLPYVESAIEKASDACYDFINGINLELVMNKYNG
ncbi:MAG: aminoacyl-tRNA hydrolase [Clostridia bacterium]|nr:aminoacyl-tRNA hydrolase [Clostridia bacterium]